MNDKKLVFNVMLNKKLNKSFRKSLLGWTFLDCNLHFNQVFFFGLLIFIERSFVEEEVITIEDGDEYMHVPGTFKINQVENNFLFYYPQHTIYDCQIIIVKKFLFKVVNIDQLKSHQLLCFYLRCKRNLKKTL